MFKSVWGDVWLGFGVCSVKPYIEEKEGEAEPEYELAFKPSTISGGYFPFPGVGAKNLIAE
jgi:hypothetical protein